MTDLHQIQQKIVARISERPVGSASRFRLMDAADAISRAIVAEEREAETATATAKDQAP